MREIDVAIIGAGTAGLSAVKEIKECTDNFLLFDGGALGTTCARVGCMPSKLLIQTANDFHRRYAFESQGIGGANSLTVDTKKVLQNVRHWRDYFVNFVLESIQNLGSHFVPQWVRFVEPNILLAGDEKIKARRIVIATGSAPVVPKEWRAFGARTLTTDEFFEIEDLPRSIAVIGLGVVGIEIGQALSRLGVQVFGFSRSRSLAGLSDPKVTATVQSAMLKEFPLYLGSEVIVTDSGKQLTVRSEAGEVGVDSILVSVGRDPNLAGLGLEGVGVTFEKNRLAKVNSETLQVGDFPIFIAGDIHSENAVLHEAADEGKIAGYNSVHESSAHFLRKPTLAVTFSDPNTAVIGCRFSKLPPQGVLIGEASFEGQGRAVIMKKNTGLLRIYAESQSGKILGCELFAPAGEHLAHLLALSIQQNLTVEKLLELPFYHPVVEEGLRTALRNLQTQL